MSDQKKIVEDLFQQQRSKKQKNQKAKPTATGQTAATGSKKRDDEKKEDTQAAQQTQSQQQDFAESSDEETKIELDEKTAVIKDAKEVEASKRKENEKEQQEKFGWAGLDKKSQQTQPVVTTTTAKPLASEPAANTKAAGMMGEYDGLKASVSSSKPTGQAVGGIQFKKDGPQTFKKSKNALNQQEFPEIGDSGSKKSDQVNQSKKDSTSIGHFGSSFATGKPNPKPAEEEKEIKEVKEPKMPVFTKKIKVTTEQSQHVENIPQQQNYDFSKMKMSQASNKPAGPRPEVKEGEAQQKQEPREPREPRGEHHEHGTRGDHRGRGRGGFERQSDRPRKDEKESDDSFEEVKERRKPVFHRGSKPSAQI